MFPEERQQAILDLLERDGKVYVKTLSEKFEVTEDRIRKDLGTLEMDGKLKRTYGGAVARQAVPQKKTSTDAESKKKIASAAVKLIGESDLIFLDISTSNILIAEKLLELDREVRVATNMIEVLTRLAHAPKVKLIFAGGVINRNRNGFLGGATLDFISKLKPDIAFLGAVGVDVKENSVSTFDVEDGINKAKIISMSKNSYVVAESSKLNSDGNYNYASLDELSGLITDEKPSEDICHAAEEFGVKLILP
ncbi:MAG: DeoR/GlpR transcriptional regulator [Selenomonadaceae bacterium]|nr:DeoR/GlpR transcriptional regulator [Selenomonadaceae bacterium]